jgi:hypothetical protein
VTQPAGTRGSPRRVKRPARPRVPLAPMWPVDRPREAIAEIGDGFLLSALPDGWRCLVVLDDRVRIRSRAGHDLTPKLPRLRAALAAACSAAMRGAATTVLDAILALPPASSAPEPTLDAVCALHVLDVLCWKGTATTRAALARRRAHLQELRATPADSVRVVATWRGDARAALEQLETAGQDAAGALLARLESSPYRPGIRSAEWLRFGAEPLREFLLCGIADSGALVLATPGPRGLAFAGLCWPTRAWSGLALRCSPAEAPFPLPGVWSSLGRVTWAAPTMWVAVRPDIRAGSGLGGPRWRLVRVQEDLTLAPPSLDGASSGTATPGEPAKGAR